MDQRVTTWDVSELFMILDLSLCASYIPYILLYHCAIVMKRLRLLLRLLPSQSWNLESELFFCFHAQCVQAVQLSPRLPACGSVRLLAKQFTDQWECWTLGSAC